MVGQFQRKEKIPTGIPDSNRKEIELEIVDAEEWEAIELVLSQCHPSQQARPTTPPMTAVADTVVSDDEPIKTKVTRTDESRRPRRFY